jgi:putative transposase
VVTDVTGLPMAVIIRPANEQDRDVAVDVIQAAHDKYKLLAKIWADGGYEGKCETAVRAATGCEVEIVRRSDDAPREVWITEGEEPPVASGFKIIKWRWIVERTFGWLGRYRRLSKDYEQSPASSLAWVRIALVWMLVRRLGAG